MDFETIEDRIIETLRAELPQAATVQTYAGQLEREMDRLPLRYPAVFVAYGGSAFEWVDGPNHRETVRFSVLVAAKDLRGEGSARKEDKGAYGLVNDVLKALCNQDLGLQMERLTPTSVSLVHVGTSVALYAVELKAGFDKQYEW